MGTEQENEKFWQKLKKYLAEEKNSSQILKMESPNQSWVNIQLLPLNENKEAHIVLRINKNKAKVEYYIDDNKPFFNYLHHRKNEIDLENNYIWVSSSQHKRSKISKEISLSENTSNKDIYDWYLKEIVNIYNTFPYYLSEFLTEVEQYIVETRIKKSEFSLEENYYIEGKRIERIVNQIERNPLARKKCIEHKGTTCEICGLNFEEKYGSIGKDYIEVHHIKPLSEIDSEYIIDPIKDLIPVCSNCHSMLHRKINGKRIEVDELKSIVVKRDNK